MPFNKKRICCRKGYILIYTLFIGFLIIMIGVYFFSISQMKITREIEDLKTIAKGNIDENYTEKILSDINENIIGNVNPLSEEGIIQYIKNSNQIHSLDGNLYLIETIYTKYYNATEGTDKYELMFDNHNNYFISRYYVDNDTLRENYFTYTIQENNLSFHHINTIYKNK